MAEPSKEPKPPLEAKRIRAFAHFFKNYMSVSTIVIAALPIPITAFKLIPIFQQQLGMLEVYTPMFCFLLLGYIFYIRHSIARWLFPQFLTTKSIETGIAGFVKILPAIFILISFFSILIYYDVLTGIIADIRDRIVNDKTGQYSTLFFNIPAKQFNPQKMDLEFILTNFQISSIKISPSESVSGPVYYMGEPFGSLIFLYFLTFLFAEMAFILMAIKEFLQDTLGLTENMLIERRKAIPAVKKNL